MPNSQNEGGGVKRRLKICFLKKQKTKSSPKVLNITGEKKFPIVKVGEGANFPEE